MQKTASFIAVDKHAFLIRKKQHISHAPSVIGVRIYFADVSIFIKVSFTSIQNVLSYTGHYGLVLTQSSSPSHFAALPK